MIVSRVSAALLLAALSPAAPEARAAGEQLVFGSFRLQQNAERWAQEIAPRLDRPLRVDPARRDDGTWYRVHSETLNHEQRARLESEAAGSHLAVWTLPVDEAPPAADGEARTAPAAGAVARALLQVAGVDSGGARSAPQPVSTRPVSRPPTAPAATVYTDFDLGVQTRTYTQRGVDGQGRFQPSLSASLEYYRAWNDDRSSITFTPFLRVDAEDDERTHADVRELFWSHVGGNWELHVGARQIFWGVTEFNHLVDIINQTDLVENIDGEDKLGQPMVQLSLVRDWGIVDFFALTGFRERTFPGEDGRLRGPVPVDTDHPVYESGAGRHRVDGAVRWSNHVGPVNFGLYHFSGTSRDPRFVARVRNGRPVLVPEYDVVDQTGFDGQAIFGDWAWKLEAVTRSGQGDRYYAYTAGFERTLVGVLGSRSDLGIVVEYMYDERGEKAFDTLFEHDLALGARWRANDIGDTTALAGVIWDDQTDEYVLSLEASRRFGASWTAVLEGRVFGGVQGLQPGPFELSRLDASLKTQALQDDDFVQLELTRYF